MCQNKLKISRNNKIWLIHATQFFFACSNKLQPLSFFRLQQHAAAIQFFRLQQHAAATQFFRLQQHAATTQFFSLAATRCSNTLIDFFTKHFLYHHNSINIAKIILKKKILTSFIISDVSSFTSESLGLFFDFSIT